MITPISPDLHANGADIIMKTALVADNAAEAMAEKLNLVGLDRTQMVAKLTPLGIEPFRAKQIWQWM